jgi:AcrR family transcriptional regulator
MAETTREKMIETADRLFRSRGYHGTSWRTLVEESRTPWGSVHHHFPGGKEELGVAAMRHGAEVAFSYREHLFDKTGSVPDGIRLWFEKTAEHLERSGWQLGCPIATVALEMVNESEALADASAEMFGVSEENLARRLRTAGLPRARARDLATLIFGAFEGALILARVQRSRQPLLLAGKHFAATVAAELRRPV